MKKLLIVALIALLPAITKAANGDTTWVQAHSDIWLDHYGNHDTMIQFPNGATSYRRVYMIWTLGKYQCPGSPQYCGDWDYTVNNYLMTKTGDTVELGRFITPYANAGSPRTPWTWKQRYVFDVTDYYTLLKDSATVRINYSGYSWGFTANVKFAFVEGTPARNVLGVNRLWNGYFNYGGATPIDNAVAQKSLTAPNNTQFAALKFIVSGHGSDNNYCSEFCKKYYQVKLNGNQIEQKDMWRDNCGKNHIYPQSGTWVYDRGNWCPGDIVFANTHKLPGITSGNNFDVDVDFEPYTSPNGGAGFGVNGAVFYYGGYNHTKDASLEDIIAPSNHETHFRENPCGGKPIIEVMNNGADAITNMKIEYGVDGGTKYTYNWTGNLVSLDKVKITLPEIIEIRTATGSNNSFTAKISEVNGGADADATNDQLKSYFVAAPKWPNTVRVNFRTNNVANETRWKIYDGLNNIVAQREGASPATTYIDTVNFGPGSYRLVFEDDGCDGLSWWANSAAGSGSIIVRALTNLTSYPLSGYFGGDFGCGFTQEFTVYWPTSVETIKIAGAAMEISPNPATNQVTVTFDGTDIKGTLNVIDMTGRVVLNQACNTAETTINTSALTNGVYSVIYVGNNGIKSQSKLIIAK